LERKTQRFEELVARRWTRSPETSEVTSVDAVGKASLGPAGRLNGIERIEATSTEAF
jgi:hypothetical protein